MLSFMFWVILCYDKIDCYGFMSIWGYFIFLELNFIFKIDIVNFIKCFFLGEKKNVKYLFLLCEMDYEMFKVFWLVVYLICIIRIWFKYFFEII